MSYAAEWLTSLRPFDTPISFRLLSINEIYLRFFFLKGQTESLKNRLP